MKQENMVEHKGMFLTSHFSQLAEDHEELSGWEIMLQYELYEERRDREKFYVEVFYRPEQKPYKLKYTIDDEGDAEITPSEELLDDVKDNTAVDHLMELTKEALEGYASVLFLQGQST